MPVYDYRCDDKHVTEQRQGIEVSSIPCPVCGQSAQRVQVYQQQYMQAETGPVGGKKNDVPPDQKNLHQDYSEFQEAQAEVEHAYAKEGKEAPDLFARAHRKAKKLNPRIK